MRKQGEVLVKWQTICDKWLQFVSKDTIFCDFENIPSISSSSQKGKCDNFMNIFYFAMDCGMVSISF